jgi:hypothetical protein
MFYSVKELLLALGVIALLWMFLESFSAEALMNRMGSGMSLGNRWTRLTTLLKLRLILSFLFCI